jgi:hypothetical protein
MVERVDVCNCYFIPELIRSRLVSFSNVSLAVTLNEAFDIFWEIDFRNSKKI